MDGRTGSTANDTLYEFYYDYLDPVSFDESELKANKYSIVIAVWIGLAAFSVFLFLILLYMSRTDSPGAKTRKKGEVSPLATSTAPELTSKFCSVL
ncbi:melanocortin-2 receptor accessory protein [Hyla sarda]|uniref:melanocortin-2 receptor accessory protein n=1 Tax=Hyla sarda TaxID=327740 RepID=UPI0024C409F8|nr:melanocortin-2 receptor accessory protein [Hyla sarda]